MPLALDDWIPEGTANSLSLRMTVRGVVGVPGSRHRPTWALALLLGGLAMALVGMALAFVSIGQGNAWLSLDGTLFVTVGLVPIMIGRRAWTR